MEAWQVFAADPELYGERLERYFSKPRSVRRMAIPAYYPRSSRSLDVADNPNMFGDGIVMARYTVTDRGRVEDVEIIESDPSGLLDDKVVSALRRSYFRPEFQDGLPVSRPDMTFVHEFKYDKTELKVAEEEKSDENERLPNPNEMDRNSSGALEYPQ
jgi:TonB family protein